MRRPRYALLALPCIALGFNFLSSCSKAPDAPADGGKTASTPDKSETKKLKIGYVLHIQNDFTQVIKRGAEDAGKALGVDVEVVGPSSSNGTEAIGMFEGMVQKKMDGLVVVPMGDVWVKPIKEATDASIPVATSNMISPDSGAASWFGQDEYQSGVILAKELTKALTASGVKEGKILVGNCAPGIGVLEDRYKGFKKGLEGTAYKATDEKNVGTENTANYSNWENQATANKDMVAAAGLCSMDVPNLAKLKTRSKAKWLIGGYDLNPDTLKSIKDGTAQVTLGQHPYLQGYLPVLALVKFLRDKQPLPKTWVDVGTEIVTKENVDQVLPRETSHEAETKWYADYVAKNFGDLTKLGKPLPKAP